MEQIAVPDLIKYLKNKNLLFDFINLENEQLCMLNTLNYVTFHRSASQPSCTSL